MSHDFDAHGAYESDSESRRIAALEAEIARMKEQIERLENQIGMLAGQTAYLQIQSFQCDCDSDY